MRASAHHLADELIAGHADDLLSRCAADEVNLAMALERAYSMLVDGTPPVPDELSDATVDGCDEDYYEASASLRQDSDVDVLWNLRLDGIESDGDTLGWLGAAYLHPDDWFEFFTHVRPAR